MPLEILRAGPLTLLLDPTNGFVRRIRLGEHEVLRGIYAAVRDRNWDTVPGCLREMRRKVRIDSFDLVFEVTHRKREVHFGWTGRMSGTADGTLRYEFEGRAESSFLRNRIGFCVPHPIRECLGARARQTRTDGSILDCRFPELIEPQIPDRASFRDLRGVAHEIAPGVWAEVESGGDVFQMEDQRNWTDASFKTYCTPLALPFPVEVKTGQRVRQSVTLRLVGNVPKALAASVAMDDGGGMTAAMAVGLGVASHGEALNAAEIQLLRRLRPAHLRVDARLGDAAWVQEVARAARDPKAVDAALELAVILGRDGAGTIRARRGRLHLLVRQPADPRVRRPLGDGDHRGASAYGANGARVWRREAAGDFAGHAEAAL